MSKKNDKDNSVKCIICHDNLESDHSGIVCPQDHNICSECAENYVKNILEVGYSLFPPKCSSKECNLEVIPLSFERQLNEIQRANYLSLVSLKSIGDNEQLAQCPSCSYFEVWPKGDNGMCFLFCSNHQCKKTTCYYCKGQCVIPEDGGYEDHDIANPPSTSFVYHEICAELGPYKRMIENAIHKGTGSTCPSCGHLGRKDDACTHIRCVKCQERYCYVCCLSEALCDKEDATKNIYSHNVNWDINPKRCPMYLFQINEVDERWSEDDKDCVEFLSRINTIKYLKQAIDEMGFPIFERLQKKYDSIKNCGFTVDDIMNTNTIPIIIPNLEL